jgi:hypothetical protein
MKSRSIPRAAGCFAVAAASIFISSNVFGAGITLSQCANGGVKEDIIHDQCHDGWISGNANQSKAAYAEGEFLPYRVVMTGLTTGATYTYQFSWDTLKSGKHAEMCLDGMEPMSCIGTNGKPDLDLIIASINAVGGVADMFNNSGDALPNGFPSAAADPHAPEDDPTDPTD